jgi:hypothetical protein
MAQPVRPEPKFFVTERLYEQGRRFYEESCFSGKPGARVRGEKSTTYMESPVAAERIVGWYPDATLIFVLRDPIERAISNYWFSVNNGLEDLPLEDAFRREDERWQSFNHSQLSTSPYAYLRRGRYIDCLDTYLRYFPAAQLRILLHERLVGNAGAIRELYRALHVAAEFVPPSLGRVINESTKGETGLSDELRTALVEYYAEPNARLAEQFGLDLSCWRSFS